MATESKYSESSSTKRLVPKVTISDNPSEVFVVQFSPDGGMLAAGCGDGAIRVFSVATGRLMYNLNIGSSANLPTTALRFRPLTSRSKTKNVLLSVNADGTVQHWHVTSGKCLHSVTEPDNQLYCVDYRSDGEMFAAAGKDYTLRLYDEATKTMVAALSGGLGRSTPGHSNRVFSLKFNRDDENMIVSGGWDNTVQIWDVRTEHAVRSIYGPHIAGDGVDVLDGVILTGSWRPDNQLELWDLASGKLIERVPWTTSAMAVEPCMLYAAEFSRGEGKGLIAAGGSGANEAKVFDRSAGNKLVGTVAGMSRGVFTVDFAPNGRTLAVAGGDAAIRLFDIASVAGGDDDDMGDAEYKSGK